MSINLSAIRSLLLPGLYNVMGDYKDIPTQWSQVCDTGVPSDQATEKSVEMRQFGLAEAQGEGQSVKYDNNAGERFSYNTIHTGIGLGFIMTRNALKDNLYKSQFEPNVKALRFSFRQTKEIIVANLFNLGTTYDAAVGGDGVSLFNTAHLIDGGTIGNRPTIDIELNEAALEAGIIGVRRFKNAAGLRNMFRVRKLIVPVELQFVAERLLKTELRVGTADNDLNAVRSMNAVSEGYVVMDFLTGTKPWFLKTDAPYGMTYTEREPFEYDIQPDQDTKSLKTVAYERYSAWYQNWRGNWGAFPT